MQKVRIFQKKGDMIENPGEKMEEEE